MSKAPASAAWTWRHAITQSDLSPTTRHVLLTLSIFMDEAGQSCYPSIGDMIEATGLSNRAVCTHLARACEAGWLSRKLHGYGGQKWKRLEYEAIWPGREVDTPSGEEREQPQEGSERPSQPLEKAVNVGFEGGERGDVKAVNDVHRGKEHSIHQSSTTPVDSRESTHARLGEAEPQPETVAKPKWEFEPPDMAAVDAAFDAIARIWSKGSIGNSPKAKAALADLNPADLKLAVARAPRFLRALKDDGKSFKPSIESYVKGREFDHHGEPEKAPSAAPADAQLRLGPYDRPIWWMLWRAVTTGNRVKHILGWLSAGVTINASAAPSEAEESALMPVEVGTPECDAWVTYCAKLGFRLPLPNQARVIFVPSDIPPLLSTEWKGYALIEPVSLAFGSPALWWRIYQPGAPVAELLERARKSVGTMTVEMGPIASPAEIAGMIELGNLSDEFKAWSQWFWHFPKATIEMWPAHAGPIYVPSRYPPAWKVERDSDNKQEAGEAA